MHRVLKRSLAGLALLLIVAVVLALPSGLFWLRWMRPGTPIPAAAGSVGQSQAFVELPVALRGEFEAAVAELRAEAAMPALSAAVSRNGGLIWAGTRGFADIEGETVATIEHQFRIGSTAKAVTGVALARLVAAGKITIDSPIRSIAPELPAIHEAVTVGMLASHTAGVRHYSAIPTWLPSRHETMLTTHFDSVESGLGLFVEDPLLFEPGTSFQYSTFGFSLLSYVMERASGMEFGALLEAEINEPAGTRFRLDDIGKEIPIRVTYYTTGGGNYTAAFPADPSYKWAGGGMIATPAELATLGQKLMFDDTFIRPDLRSKSWTAVAVPGSETNPQNYALGWRRDISIRLLGEERPTLMINHGGRQVGGASFWMILPEYGISAAAATNTGAGEAREAVQEAAYALARALINAQSAAEP